MTTPPRLTASPPPPTPVSDKVALPLRATDFDAGLAHLLHDAINGVSFGDSLAGLCRHLARVLHARLAVIGKRLDSGVIALEGTSAENSLWLELQRIPERWDSGLSSLGPGGASLRAQGAIRMRVQDEGLALWQAAAQAEHVVEVFSLPLRADDGARVLSLHLGAELAAGARSGTVTVSRFAASLEQFIADLREIERRQLAARALECAGNAAFITDLQGTIVWSNPAFSTLSGYPAEEVRGRNPNLLRSGEQGVRYYRDLWGTIRAGRIWSGETVDRDKDGETYTIQQTVSPVSQDGRITHYVSIHQDIGRQKRDRTRLELASRLDPDTGLLTPAAFDAELQQALAHGAPLALVVVSLRGLQRAEPGLGEDLANLVGVAMGRRVHEIVTEPGKAGILRPFEYALLLQGDVNLEAVRARLRTLGEKLEEPLPYLGTVPLLDLHFGIALAPAEGTTARDLRLRAERRLADEPYERARRDARH